MVTVVVLDDLPPGADGGPRQDRVRVERMRGRGPGGQRKNKAETAVRVRHLPTGVTVTRTSGRSQAANLASARAQLDQKLRARADSAARAGRNQSRRDQLSSAPQSRVFTHSTQRGRVTENLAGRSWDLRAWQQGRFGDVTS